MNDELCCTFPPPGWCLMLSVEPILERTILISVAEAEPGRGAGRAVALAVVELGRDGRGAGGFLSAAAVLLVVEGVFVGRALILLVAVDVRRGAVLERAASETETHGGSMDCTKSLDNSVLKGSVSTFLFYPFSEA